MAGAQLDVYIYLYKIYMSIRERSCSWAAFRFLLGESACRGPCFSVSLSALARLAPFASAFFLPARAKSHLYASNREQAERWIRKNTRQARVKNLSLSRSRGALRARERVSVARSYRARRCIFFFAPPIGSPLRIGP